MQQRRQPPTPARDIGERPPGREAHRMDDTAEEVVSAISMDPYYVDTPARRQQTEAILMGLHEDSLKKNMHIQHMEEMMEVMSEQMQQLRDKLVMTVGPFQGRRAHRRMAMGWVNLAIGGDIGSISILAVVGSSSTIRVNDEMLGLDQPGSGKESRVNDEEPDLDQSRSGEARADGINIITYTYRGSLPAEPYPGDSSSYHKHPITTMENLPVKVLKVVEGNPKDKSTEPTLPSPTTVVGSPTPAQWTADHFKQLHASKGTQYDIRLTEYDYDESTPGEKTDAVDRPTTFVSINSDMPYQIVWTTLQKGSLTIKGEAHGTDNAIRWPTQAEINEIARNVHQSAHAHKQSP